MKTKLTLRLEDDVIARAKAYAAQRGTSVSGLVEDYFRVVAESVEAIGGDGAPNDWRAALSPRVQALVDRSAPHIEVSEGDYKRYLEIKYR